jgi:ABC-type ATPase with predicted acetyltransferase domain
MSEKVNVDAVTAAWRSAFKEDIKEHLEQVGSNTGLLTEEAYTDIMLFMQNMDELSAEATAEIKLKRLLKDKTGRKNSNC